MKKYFLPILVFICCLFSLFSISTQYAEGEGLGAQCVPKVAPCNPGLICTNLDPVMCKKTSAVSSCQLVCKKVATGTECVSNSLCQTAGLVCDLSTNKCQASAKSGQHCTGTGQGNCASGYSCKIPNIPSCQPVINPKLCQPTCQKNPVSDLGKTCKKNSDCSGNEVCKVTNPNACTQVGMKDPHACDKSCQKPPPPPPPPTDTPPPSTCFSDAQCPPNNLCSYNPFECAHDGINCNGTCSPVQTPPKPTITPTPQLPPCKLWNNGECKSTSTGVGTFATDPSQFIKTIFDILLSISGGIALLLIIKSGYQLLTSQGKPEAIQNGRDQLIAAIVGLIFLIFSFVALQVIGFDILKIPGFGQ